MWIKQTSSFVVWFDDWRSLIEAKSRRRRRRKLDLFIYQPWWRKTDIQLTGNSTIRYCLFSLTDGVRCVCKQERSSTARENFLDDERGFRRWSAADRWREENELLITSKLVCRSKEDAEEGETYSDLFSFLLSLQIEDRERGREGERHWKERYLSFLRFLTQ